MRPKVRTPTRAPADFENLGKAFEGLAGALHEGQRPEREDLEEACRTAHDLWPVRGGGRAAEEQDYEAARQECHRQIAAACEGDMRACMALERACHHVGMALRWKGRGLEAGGGPRGSAAARPWEAAHDCRASIRRLDHKYARYA
ncbi:MAG: hypothetical protein LC620_06570, partial [Halobacteriales archaeon]|nr:hypothetical protein [Halobacteriales archaeon]